MAPQELADIATELTSGDETELPGVKSWTKHAFPLPFWLLCVSLPSALLVASLLSAPVWLLVRNFYLHPAALLVASVAVGTFVLYWRTYVAFPPAPQQQAGASQKRVAIIGGGSAGLVCAKSVKEEGMQPVIFEKGDNVGGLWRFDEARISVYRNTELTSSKHVTAYSDLRMDDNENTGSKPDFMRHSDYLAYLHQYARRFGLLEPERCRLNCVVLEVEPVLVSVNGHGNKPKPTESKVAKRAQWRVRYRTAEGTGETRTEMFDAVAVCSGLNSAPKKCRTVPGLYDFDPAYGSDSHKPNTDDGEGESKEGNIRVIHSAGYVDATPFKDKRVVVIGGGESASDIAYEVTQVSRHTMVCLRRGVFIMPKTMAWDSVAEGATRRGDIPADYFHFACTYFLPFALYSLMEQSLQWLVHFKLKQAMAQLRSKPKAKVKAGVRGGGQAYNHALTRRKLIALSNYDSCPGAGHERSPAADGQTPLLVEGTYHSQYITKSTSLLVALAQPNCSLHIAQNRLEAIVRDGDGDGKGKGGTGVYAHFADDTRERVDAVIVCTGFATSMGFLPAAVRSAVAASPPSCDCPVDFFTLYKKIFVIPPAASPEASLAASPAAPAAEGEFSNEFSDEFAGTFAFVGFGRPELGAQPPIAEMQARYFASVVSGRCALPPPQRMRETTEQEQRWFMVHKGAVARRMRALVTFVPYQYELAGYMDCVPEWWRLIFHPLLLWNLFCGTVHGSHFRLHGFGARPEYATETLLSQGLLPYARRAVAAKLKATLGGSADPDDLGLNTDEAVNGVVVLGMFWGTAALLVYPLALLAGNILPSLKWMRPVLYPHFFREKGEAASKYF